MQHRRMYDPPAHQQEEVNNAIGPGSHFMRSHLQLHRHTTSCIPRAPGHCSFWSSRAFPAHALANCSGNTDDSDGRFRRKWHQLSNRSELKERIYAVRVGYDESGQEPALNGAVEGDSGDVEQGS